MTKNYNELELKKAAKAIRALNHPLRQDMLDLIAKHDGVCVENIYKPMRIEQSVCSQHLKVLRDANLVFVTPKGKQKHYSINTGYLSAFNNKVAELVNLR